MKHAEIFSKMPACTEKYNTNVLNIIEIFSYGGGVRFGRESLWKRLSNGTEKLVYTIFLLHNKRKKIIMKKKIG